MRNPEYHTQVLGMLVSQKYYCPVPPFPHITQGLKLTVAHSPLASKFSCGPPESKYHSPTWRPPPKVACTGLLPPPTRHWLRVHWSGSLFDRGARVQATYFHILKIFGFEPPVPRTTGLIV